MAAAATATVSICQPAEAREAAQHRIDIPATTLPQAIGTLSRQAGVSIGTEGLLPDRRTPAVHGRLTVEQALARLLAGSGYIARRVGDTAWRIERRVSARPPARPPTPDRSPPPALESDDTIIVTATKREAALAGLPLAVSVFVPSPTDAVDPASDTARVASAVEDFAVSGLGPGRNRMFLRGIADSAFNGESQSTVAVVLDGTRLTYSAPDPDIRLIDVERVEVIKGPQGSLYGTGALGGIYHIVTKRPDAGGFAAGASGGATLVSGGGTGLSGSAFLNLPLARNSAGLRLVGYLADEPGWIDTGSRRDSNRTQVTGARAALGIDAGSGWQLDLSGLLQLIGARDSQYVYAAGARARPAQLAEPHDNDLYHVAGRLTHSGAVDVELVSGMTWHEVDDRLDATIGAGQFGLPDPQTLVDNRQYRLFDNELRVSSDRGPLRWLAGVSYVHAAQDLALTLASVDAALAIDDDRRTTDDLALFGDVGLALSSALDLDLGARLFHTRTTEARAVPAGTEFERVARTGFTPSAALSWRPGSGKLLYLRYGSAVRPGGSDIGAAGQLDLLKGDELATLEAGWRQSLGGGQLDAGVWYSNWEDVQSDMLESNGLIETRNAGRARIFGAEASLSIPLGRGWTIDGGANVVSARLVRNDLGIEVDDRRLPVVPEYTARLALGRAFTIGGADAALTLRLRYVGPSRLSFDPAIDRPMGKLFESRIEGRVTLGGFDIVASVDNLLGEDEDSFAFGNPLRFATTRQYIPMAPRQVSLALSRRF